MDLADQSTISAFRTAISAQDAAALRRLAASDSAFRQVVDAPLFSFDAPAIVHCASHRGITDALLELGADINAKSAWWAGGFGVLHVAQPSDAAYFIERGATVDAHVASRLGLLERLTHIVETDPYSVDRRGPDGQTPLHFAASPAIAAFLLDRGASLDVRDLDHSGTPAQWALKTRPEVCRYLLSRGADADIFMACVLDDVQMAQRLLTANPECLSQRIGAPPFVGDIEHVRGDGHIYLYEFGSAARPVFLAARYGSSALMDLLLKYAPGNTRFQLACVQADRPRIQAALSAQPDLVATLSEEDLGLLADAAWTNNLPAVEAMLEIGWPVDAVGRQNGTALDRAAVRGYADIVSTLLLHHANTSVVNGYGDTPLQACRWGATNFRDPAGDYAKCLVLLDEP
jgi:ankyrin repeat protein